MKRLTILGALALLAAVVGVGSLPSATASNAIATSEDLACTTCHDKPGSKLLTDRGKYYEHMSSLAGFAQVQATFGKCTSCHARKPGSLKLTKQGKKFRSVLDDMDGLRELVLRHHVELDAPAPAPEPMDTREVGGGGAAEPARQ